MLFGFLGALAVAPPLLLARAHLREGTGPGWPGPVGAVAMGLLTLVLASLVLDAARIHIVRNDAGVTGVLNTTGFERQEALTMWWIIVNPATFEIKLAFAGGRGGATPSSRRSWSICVDADESPRRAESRRR